MPSFSVKFNRRKSTADILDTAVAGSSFRVLDRPDVSPSYRHSHGHRYSISGDDNANDKFAVKSRSVPNNLAADNEVDHLLDNMNTTRSSANTTITNSTDNLSRHSNVSTAPSSADLNAQQQQQPYPPQPPRHEDDYRGQGRVQYDDVYVAPLKASSTSSFLKSAGRTLSFGTNKKHMPYLPDNGNAPQTPSGGPGGRNRSMTASTVTTATPPKIEEEYNLDMGGDFSSMLDNFDSRRASVATLRMEKHINGDWNGDAGRPALVPRSLTGNRLNQPAPLQVDRNANVEPSPYSHSSQTSNDRLMYNHDMDGPASANENAPPVPRHATPLSRDHSGTLPPLNDAKGLKRSSAVFGRRRSTMVEAVPVDLEEPADAADAEDEDTVLLKDSYYSVTRFLDSEDLSAAQTPAPTTSRFGRDVHDSEYSMVPTESESPTYTRAVPATADDEDNLFQNSNVHSARTAPRFASRKPSPPPRNKVMTPAQFERYRKDKERDEVRKSVGIYPVDSTKTNGTMSDSDDEDNYEDEIDEAEKSRQAAKQRRKQEAHMSVYRQQMMKVTGETSGATGPAARSSMSFSMSTPNLTTLPNDADVDGNEEDDDEEVPLAILAAHGFPNRNRPPARLNTMSSNPNLRAAAAPSYQRPQSAMGDAPQSGGRLPVFARNLPQDPYGLVNNNQRESLSFAGGAPASGGGGLPPGGLVGVIASEERSRAMRRGSPNVDGMQKPLLSMMSGANAGYDPMAGIPAHAMYPGVGAGMGGQMPMLSLADQAQIQMTQQMQQFMQMQMQFMQMVANGGGNGGNGGNGQRPMSQGTALNMAGMGGMNMNGNEGSVRQSFVDNGSMLDLHLPPRLDLHSRTMSLVQPSSASWVQPQQSQQNTGGYAPSIRVQGASHGYTASIAPSERNTVGMPGRYRPVSYILPGAVGGTSPSMEPTPGPTSGASSPGWDLSRKNKTPSPLHKEAVTVAAATVVAVDDDDDEEGWAEMKAKRDKKRSMWKTKKMLSSDIGALIS